MVFCTWFYAGWYPSSHKRKGLSMYLKLKKIRYLSVYCACLQITYAFHDKRYTLSNGWSYKWSLWEKCKSFLDKGDPFIQWELR